jgi:putative bacteriocin precursor
MKKLGKKLNLTNETLKAYCTCGCTSYCTIKCACLPASVLYSNLFTTNASTLYSNTGTANK